MRSSSHYSSLSTPSSCLICIAVVIGIALRLLSLRGELWLDEGWSLLLVQEAHSPLQIFSAIRHDNNHLLNSLWLWAIGPQASEWLMRLPAALFSALMLVSLSRCAKRVAPGFKGALWCLLVAVSYPLVLLGSEARGYSLMLLCAVLGFQLTLRLREQSASISSAALFALVSIVGFLAHASFLLFLAPALVWLLLERRRNGARLLDRVAIVAGALPAAACTLAWWSLYRGAEIGGGPIAPYLQVALSAVAVALGASELSALAPEQSALAAAVALCAIIAALAELVAWLRQGDSIAWLALLIIAAPFAAVVMLEPSFIVVRYFSVSLIFLLLLVARFLGRLACQGLLGKALTAAIVALCAYGNLSHARVLIVQGRSCAGWLLEQAAQLGGVVTIGGDMDNRNELRLRYLKLRAAPIQNLEYVRQYATAAGSPSVIMRERSEQGAAFPQQVALENGARYTKLQSCSAALLEGGEVVLYARLGN